MEFNVNRIEDDEFRSIQMAVVRVG